jgi:hypothetical protein
MSMLGKVRPTSGRYKVLTHRHASSTANLAADPAGRKVAGDRPADRPAGRH